MRNSSSSKGCLLLLVTLLSAHASAGEVLFTAYAFNDSFQCRLASLGSDAEPAAAIPPGARVTNVTFPVYSGDTYDVTSMTIRHAGIAARVWSGSSTNAFNGTEVSGNWNSTYVTGHLRCNAQAVPLIFRVTYEVPLANKAEVVPSTSQLLPGTVLQGSRQVVVVTMKNVGQSTWTDAGGYRLGLVADNVWGITRIGLGGQTVRPGESKRFEFAVTAPNGPGKYKMTVQMLRESVEWFGPSAGGEVRVISKATAAGFSDVVSAALSD